MRPVVYGRICELSHTCFNASTSSKNIYHTTIRSCAEYSTSTCYISPTKRGTDTKYQENTKKPGSTIARRTLQCTRAGIRQQLHTLHCYVPGPLSHLVEVFTSLLSSSTDQDKPTVTVTYDTTFNLCEFYVSVLLFRETEFDPSPIVSLAFLLHERKLQSIHDEFFSHIHKLCPQLDDAVNVII